jgi:hypothetical protein
MTAYYNLASTHLPYALAMILDSYKLSTTIFQIQYKDAVELWDNAGSIARSLITIWPDLKLQAAKPDSQIFQSKEVHIQTTLDKGTLTLNGKNGFDDIRVKKVKETFEIWREKLELTMVERISTRVIYYKEFPTLAAANAAHMSMNLVRLPTGKVFDQPTESDKNTTEVRFRFEDDKSFSFLRLATDGAKYEVEFDPDWVESQDIKKEKFRAIIDFDRGMLGTVDAHKFRVEDWFTGFQHVLRRDLEKVIKV